MCVCAFPGNGLLVPTEHSKATKCFLRRRRRHFRNEILKLFFVWSVPLRERFVDSHEGLEGHKVFFCHVNQKHFLNGILK